eukprot:UN02119
MTNKQKMSKVLFEVLLIIVDCLSSGKKTPPRGKGYGGEISGVTEKKSLPLKLFSIQRMLDIPRSLKQPSIVVIQVCEIGRIAFQRLSPK